MVVYDFVYRIYFLISLAAARPTCAKHESSPENFKPLNPAAIQTRKLPIQNHNNECNRHSRSTKSKCSTHTSLLPACKHIYLYKLWFWMKCAFIKLRGNTYIYITTRFSTVSIFDHKQIISNAFYQMTRTALSAEQPFGSRACANNFIAK